MDVVKLAEAIIPRVAAAGLRLVLEPGRALVGDAGVLLTRVEYVKRTESKTFVIVDGGMSEPIRPSHYGGYHAIDRVSPPSTGEPEPVDVVGPICESGDYFAKARSLPPLAAGDLIAVRSVGAYGAVMASTYNGRDLAPEVLVNGAEWTVVAKRLTWRDTLQRETVPDWLDDAQARPAMEVAQ